MPAKRHGGKQVVSRPPPPVRQATGNNPQDSGTAAAVSTSSDQSFLQELTWCLDRLQTQMKLRNVSARQMEESTRAWKCLSNPHTALVKKRQVMRTLFGDYRATMEQEDKQYSIRPQGMTIANVASKKALSSKYFKSSQHAAPHLLRSTADNFQFDFSISEGSEKAPVADITNGSDIAAVSSPPQSTAPLSVNYYHMQSHGTDKSLFKFGFNVDDS